jgi:hypothetical protein
MKAIPENVHESLAKETLEQVKAHLGDGWSNLSEQERLIIADVVSDVTTLQIEAQLTPRNSPAWEQLKQERAIVDGSIDDIASVESSVVRAAIWGTVQTLISKGAQLALGAMMA